MAPDRNTYEDTYVKKEETKQRSFDIRYKNEIELWKERKNDTGK